MSGNFFGGQFFGGGFFGSIQTGAADPSLWDKRRRNRCVLPDGSVVYATRAEMRHLLAKLAVEYQDEERKIVPSIKRERKREVRKFVSDEDVEFQIPQVRISKATEISPFSLDAEAMLRAYIEGKRLRTLRKDEEEWLLIMVQ